MGFYVNPPLGSKEDWLSRNAEAVAKPEFPPAPGMVLLCLIDNGPFTALAVIPNQREFDEFIKEDGRIRFWFQTIEEELQLVFTPNEWRSLKLHLDQLKQPV